MERSLPPRGVRRYGSGREREVSAHATHHDDDEEFHHNQNHDEHPRPRFGREPFTSRSRRERSRSMSEGALIRLRSSSRQARNEHDAMSSTPDETHSNSYTQGERNDSEHSTDSTPIYTRSRDWYRSREAAELREQLIEEAALRERERLIEESRRASAAQTRGTTTDFKDTTSEDARAYLLVKYGITVHGIEKTLEDLEREEEIQESIRQAESHENRKRKLEIAQLLGESPANLSSSWDASTWTSDSDVDEDYEERVQAVLNSVMGGPEIRIHRGTPSR